MAIKDKILSQKSERKISTKQYVMFAVYFASGFVLSLGRVAGDVTPFGVSFTAAAPKKFFPFAAAGAAAGCLVSGISSHSARYLFGIAMALLGSLAAAAFELYKNPLFVMSVAFASDFLSGSVLWLRQSGTAEDFVIVLSEAVLCGGGTYFFYRSINSDYRRFRFKALPLSDVSCIVISAGLMLMNLSSLAVGVMHPARAVAMFAVLLAVRFSGEKQALVLSLALGFSLSVAGGDVLFTVGAIAFSTLVALLFKGLMPFASALGFLCSSGFFAAAAANENSLSFFVDSLAATLVFVLIPSKINAKLEQLISSDEGAAHDGSLRQNLVLKLRFASSAMVAISESVDTVRERINEITRQKNDLEKGSMTDEEYIRREIVLEKTNQIREVASDQFFSIADMLEDLAFEFDEAEIFDTAAAEKIRRLLGTFEIYPASVSVIEDKFSRIRVEVLSECDASPAKDRQLTAEIGRIVGRYLDSPRVTYFKNETMLAYSERANYKLSIGFAQHSAEGKLCGDTVKTFSDGRGHSILVISDGMGKGSRAALDGAMGAGLISKLITAGFGFDSALKVVNSALLVKSNDESLATLDIANVDLYTGKCELYKAGAPASYIIKNGSVTKCELTSMPAGILRGVEFAKRTAVLGCDDCIVLMSDGICDLGSRWIESVLLSLDGLSAQETADEMLKLALNESEGKKLDDMSVIFAKLERN